MRSLGAAALLAVAALASGCGSGADVPALTGTGQAAQGRAIFSERCASCHALDDAGASGRVGPDLDDRRPSARQVRIKVAAGGGGMPAFDGQLSSAELDTVAAYVASVAGK